MDLASIAQVARAMELYKNEYEFITIVPMVASKQEDSEILLDEIETNLSEGPLYYDTEEYTDQTMQQLAEEMIREKALKLLRDEVPHGILVEVERMKRRKTMKGEPIYNIEATIYCIRESHKGIIIGKDGEMYELDCEGYFYGDGVCLIEWASQIRDILPDDCHQVTIAKDLEKGFDFREITLDEMR